MKTIFIFLILLLGCSEYPTGSGHSDNKPNNPVISVSITDNRGVKLYSENLPLINVMQLRDINTNQYGSFIFNYDIPDNWSIVFESQSISFSSIKNGSVELNYENNTYYQFFITTQN